MELLGNDGVEARRCREVSIRLVETAHEIELEVVDDGIGGAGLGPVASYSLFVLSIAMGAALTTAMPSRNSSAQPDTGPSWSREDRQQQP